MPEFHAVGGHTYMIQVVGSETTFELDFREDPSPANDDWADSALLSFIDHLIEWSADVPMLVVGTARPEIYERAAGWGGGKRNSTTIALGPLTDEETVSLISALLPASL